MGKTKPKQAVCNYLKENTLLWIPFLPYPSVAWVDLNVSTLAFCSDVVFGVIKYVWEGKSTTESVKPNPLPLSIIGDYGSSFLMIEVDCLWWSYIFILYIFCRGEQHSVRDLCLTYSVWEMLDGYAGNTKIK